MIDIDKNKPVYVIGVVAEMLGATPQMLRLYEKEKLVIPARTARNTRLYSMRDIEELQRIIRLHQDLGVNLAAIDIILNMRKKMEQMQEEFQEMVDALRERLDIQWQSKAFTNDPECTDLIPIRPLNFSPSAQSKDLVPIRRPQPESTTPKTAKSKATKKKSR